MLKKIIGIYKITNITNNKIYIGASTNVNKRWYNHKIRYNNIYSKEYNKKLYQAMRNDGIDNFHFDIIEECEISTLYEREKYYIKLYNSEYDGYNQSYGYENHNKAVLTCDDVIDIRERYAQHESKRDVYIDYKDKISFSGFHKVWNNNTWQGILPEVYTQDNIEFYKHNTGCIGEINPRTKLSNDEVLYIRKQKENEKSCKDIYLEFQDRIKFKSFQNIWYNCNWKKI